MKAATSNPEARDPLRGLSPASGKRCIGSRDRKKEDLKWN